MILKGSSHVDESWAIVDSLDFDGAFATSPSIALVNASKRYWTEASA